ncbi:hypothetical protein RUW00_22490 [Bacillus sp. IS1]|uniref:hypothetical protein n=1 Tax=Bacillus TaxID=1386 RepID=UPI0028FAB4B0|nr:MULTISPECIES: hypothetical protein [unclassified Bacillus (in: firmicutes)]MDU0078296.1 hypothetical protein [Bacillus sp. IG2]MDU0104004.1 hypothetical protein [Bacillus sp. IS1]
MKTPRVYGAIGKAPAAPRREISAAHRSCGGNRIPEPTRRRQDGLAVNCTK